MATETKLDTLEGEMKLLKGELKQGLTDVHDFLLTLKLPRQPGENPYPGDEDKLNVDGGLKLDSENKPSPPAQAEPPDKTKFEIGSGDQPAAGQGAAMPSTMEAAYERKAVAEPPENGKARAPVTSLESGEEKPGSPDSVKDAPAPAAGGKMTVERDYETVTPQVNLLANLVRWVSVAKKEIGAAQLPTFLDVYGATGNLTSELREVILQLANVVTETQPAEDSAASTGQLLTEQLSTMLDVYSINGQLSPDMKQCVLRFAKLMLNQSNETGKNTPNIWSRLILELHGILAGGGTPLHPFGTSTASAGKSSATPKKAPAPSNGSGKEQQGTAKDNDPFRLKFVLPSADGSEREFYVV